MNSASSQKPRIIVALDFADLTVARNLIARLSPHHCNLKVGKELFTVGGPAFVKELVAQGYAVFLDLKFHDIPHTVAQACKAAADLGVWMLTVHAMGGSDMLAAARMALDHPQSPLLVAVTVLTSLDDTALLDIGLTDGVRSQVLRLASLAQKQGVDGLVCSADEVALLRSHIDRKLRLVTPGIRPAGTAKDDQKRIMTPEAALAAGSDFLVIGRPITQSPDPAQVLLDIEKSLS